MAQDYCQIIRDEYQSIDKYNKDQLTSFFLRYKYFSTNDLAQVLSLSSRYIRTLKNRADIIISRSGGQIHKQKRIITVPDIKLEPGWDCAEWWRHYYKLYGTIVLSKITHLNPKTVRSRLCKYNIKMRPVGTHPISHPCCNYEWLYKHYTQLNMELGTCAKEAGVSKDTITSWLNKFKIQVKTKYGPKVKARNSSVMDEAAGMPIIAE